MNIAGVKQIVPILLKNRVVPFLWGQQGVGKTQVVEQIAKDMGGGFIPLYCGTQADPGDLLGLLKMNPDGTVSHARPEWFPTEGKGVIFLDELNRAHPDIIQAMFSFILNGTIHTHKLPDGWRIVAAGNFQSGSFNVTDTSDSAWMSRFCHIDFDPAPEESVVYFEDQGYDEVADFLRHNPDLRFVRQEERLQTQLITPNPRAYAMIGALENENALDNHRFEVYSGLIGSVAAARFQKHKKTADVRLSGRKVLNKYDTVRSLVLAAQSESSARFDLLGGAADEIVEILTKNTHSSEKHIDNLRQFLLDVPLELGLKLINKISESTWSKKSAILMDKEFVAKFKQIKSHNKVEPKKGKK